MKKSLLIALIFVFAVGMMSFGSQEAQAAEFTWTTQSCFPADMPLTDYALALWAEKVEEMSGGRMEIHVHGAGEIVGAFEVYEATRDGIIDAAQHSSTFIRGYIPATDLFYGLPAGITTGIDLFTWYWGWGGHELTQEMYYDYDEEIVFVSPLGMTPSEQLWANERIESLEDFDGLRLRGAGLAVDLYEALGASVTMLPGGEIVPAMERGVIDAAEFVDPSMDVALGFPDVAQYSIGPSLHMNNNMFQLVVNREVWEELPPDLQAIVENAAISATLEGWAKHYVESAEAFARYEELGVETIRLSPEVQQEAYELAMDLMEQKAAEDEWFEIIFTDMMDWMELSRPLSEFMDFDI